MASDPKRHPFPALAAMEPKGYLANPSGGYEAVPNELMNPTHPLSPTVTGDPASKREALIDLKALAAWQDEADRSKGELLAGTRWLAERWRWKRMRVHRFLTDLHETGTISWFKSNRKGTPSRILIVGYSRIGTATATTRRDDDGGTTKDQQPQGETRLPWDDDDGTTSWDGNEAPPHLSATARHQRNTGKVEEGDAPRKKKAARTLAPFDLGYEEENEGNDAGTPREQGQEKSGRRSCSCGASIGPTANQCARCKYPKPQEATP